MNESLYNGYEKITKDRTLRDPDLTFKELENVQTQKRRQTKLNRQMFSSESLIVCLFINLHNLFLKKYV